MKWVAIGEIRSPPQNEVGFFVGERRRAQRRLRQSLTNATASLSHRLVNRSESMFGSFYPNSQTL